MVSATTTLKASLLLLISAAASASPFPTRDQNPLLAGYGLPLPMSARREASGQWQIAADFNWSNSAIAQSDRDERLLIDAETRELRLTLGRSFADRWSFQLSLPWRYTGAGDLDSFIDGWHDVFGLPEGARRSFARDQLRITYQRDNAVLFDLPAAADGIADISTDIGYQWLADTDTAVAAWLSLKLDTGDADALTGSGAMDASLIVTGEQRFAERWSAFGQLGVTYLGDGDRLTDMQRHIVWSGLVGVSVRVWRGLALKAQLDAHSAVLDDTLEFLGEATILTVGGEYRFDSGWQLNAGVSEDIVVDASPDVVFVVGVNWKQ